MRHSWFARVVGVGAVLIACNRDDAALRRADGSPFASSGGDVQLTDGSHLQFTITSERYKQWEAARSGLRRNVVARFGKLLHPDSPTQSSIDRSIAFLETDATSRETIEGSGMTVRDFVLMTVALEQEMRLASQAGAAQRAPASDLYQPDTSAYMPAPMPATVPPTAYADSITADSVRGAVRDSLRRATISELRRADSLARHRTDSIQRSRADSLIQRKPDTLPKPPRDSLRDTLRTTPADSLTRA